MTTRSAAQIRREFIDYFAKKCGHTFVPSSPCVPLDDPTLMFTNAGMNQFKPIFLGQQAPDVDKWSGVTPGMATRAANTQKCIRAGGKHNDLDDVGHDTYHHTFFEMLGNWSFGDYFKKEAIEWAWDLLTNVWGIDPERLHATYFEGDPADGVEADNEARDLWRRILPPERIHPGNKKDNFWEMGDTGPCGPCSEIHIDLTPDKSGAKLVNAGDARVMEIWNLVFIQFNRGSDSKLTPLPAKHVDTGMGFERISAVIRGFETGRVGQVSNYDTDVFTPIFAAIQRVTGAPAYTGKLESTESGGAADRESLEHAAVMKDVAYRVVADHLRTLTFAITDGAMPSNEGRGYVLRRILRRAVRYGRQYLLQEREEVSSPELNRPQFNRPNYDRPGALRGRATMPASRPFICELVPAVADAMGEAFPELNKSHGGKNVAHVASVIRDEEASFIKTLDRGIALFEEAAEYAVNHHHGRISGEDAFKMHDTFGFPIDLTELMAEERGLSVNIGEYERLMEAARNRARAASKDSAVNLDSITIDMVSRFGPTDDHPKYAAKTGCVSATAIFDLTDRDHPRLLSNGESLTSGQNGAIILDETCFYGEQGGQVGDTGSILTSKDETDAEDIFDVQSTVRIGDVVLHVGRVYRGGFAPGEEVWLKINPRRGAIMQNHTVTHVMNWALRDVLGDHVQQKGSLVDPDKTRFDFSHTAQVTEEELAQIEELVNAQIEEDLAVYTAEVEQKKAREINTLRAVFGEKYPDVVRVVSIGVPVDQLLSDPKNDEWMRYSVEFCGGTHVAKTSEIARFRIVEESAVAKGIRRIIGVTGERAAKAEADARAVARLLKDAAGAPDESLSNRLAEITAIMTQSEIPVVEKARFREDMAHLQDRAKKAQKEAAKAGAGEVLSHADSLLSDAPRVGNTAIVCGALPGAAVDQLRAACDSLRAKAGSAAVLLATESEGKVVLLAAMTADVVGRGVKAGELIRDIAPVVGGKGGGRPDMAQGGGPDAAKIDEAVTTARQWLTQRIS